MAEVIYAEPTTRTPLHFDVLPAIKQNAEITKIPLAPPPAPVQNRPTDYHAEPKNIPPIQQQIKETAQPYTPTRIVDDRGSGNGVGGTALRTSPRIQTGNIGVNFAVNSGSGAIGGELAYEANWYVSGLLNGLFPNNQTEAFEASIYHPSAEGGFYELGKKNADNLKRMWDNRPDFELPKVQLPKFERPGMPDIFKPKPKLEPQPKPTDKPIPGQPKPTVDEPKPEPEPRQKEEDIPRLDDPKPRPIPKDLERQLRELELSPCGSISFGTGVAYKITSPTEFETVSTDKAYGFYLSLPGAVPYKDKMDFLISGSTGSVITRNGYKYQQTDGRSFAAPNTDYPYYAVGGRRIEITKRQDKKGMNTLLDGMTSVDGAFEVVYIFATQGSASECPLGKPDPLPEPPPDPPEDCDCMAKCCPDIDYRKIQKIIEEEVKKLDVTAAIPQSWQIRHEGESPQMVIQCAERKSAGTDKVAAKYASAMYPITIPHYKGGENDKPSIPPYTKGNWEGILVLKDNTKVTINAQNEVECTKVLNAVKQWIKADMLKGSYFKGGIIKTDKPLKQVKVYARYGRYFGKGQKDGKPDWRVDL